MAPKLYIMAASPPSRAVLLTAKAIGLELDVVVLDPMKGEHLTPEFLQINPEHRVPVLVDDGFILSYSHAINSYLVDKYGKDDSLYPKDLQKRATVNQRLNFDCGILQSTLMSITVPIFQGTAKNIPKDKAAQLVDTYAMLENVLQKQEYVAGDNLTIADLNIVATLTASAVLVPLAANRFPKISDWLDRLEKLPYYKEANQIGLDIFADIIKNIIS